MFVETSSHLYFVKVFESVKWQFGIEVFHRCYSQSCSNVNNLFLVFNRMAIQHSTLLFVREMLI